MRIRRSLRGGPRRRWFTLLVSFAALLACVSPATAAGAAGSPFRRLAASTVAFASDGTRYVAWQTRVGAPVVVFDTRTGAQRRLDLPDGCELANEEQRQRGRDAAGRFLLDCVVAGKRESSLLDATDGAVTQLPSGAPSPVVGWTAVGTRYVLGQTEASACNQSPAERSQRVDCLALYDLATGKVTYRPQSRWPDVDRPGAPAICLSLRSKVIAEERIGYARDFGYNGGYFAVSADHGRKVEIARCKGRPSTLPSRVGEPENFDLRGGIATWDTGHPGRELELEGEGTNTGSLTAYNLSSHRLKTWTLPRIPVRETDRWFSIVGVLGYSTHTANMVFWIATTAGETTRGGIEVKSSAVYAASAR